MLEFRILGPLEVVADGRALTPTRPKQRALLALLLLRAGELVTVDEIVDALWGERPPPAARNAVQGHVAALRSVVGRERIETRGGGYRLHLADAELDLDRFERLVTSARGRHPAETVDALSAALELFRGAPLAEFRYDSFASAEAARIDDLRLSALEDRLDAELALGRHAALVPELERLVREHPHRERFRGQLMLALYRSGRQAEALEAYQGARRSLLDALGIEPGQALRRLERAILNQDPRLDVAELAAAPPRVELPLPPNPLVGREEELAEAGATLVRPDVRLLTLIGPGGAGKTRLALELARHAVSRFPGGTFFVALAPLTDPRLVVPTLARALGVRDASETPLARRVAAAVGGRPTLVLLDNVEHVIAAATDVAELLAATPGLTVLATSREPLRLRAEHRYPVSPLPEEAAVALFLDRARAIRPALAVDATSRATIAEICRRLDGLPLAIELAAARMNLFSPEAMLGRLDARLAFLAEGFRDQPDRQQTLRHAIEWSYELLAPSEQRLFARLGVFAGGWTLEAADAVCGDGLDVVRGMSSLADKSLLQLDPRELEPRPTMLETVREYATERLDAAGELATLRRRHATHFLAVAEGLERALPTSDRDLLERVEREHDNLRAAIDSFTAAGASQHALRLAGALWRFWYLRGHLGEGRRRLESALAADERPTLARAKALNGAGALAMNAADVATAKDRCEAALALAEALGADGEAAYARFMLGNVAAAEDDLERAQRYYEASVRSFRELGESHFELLASRHLAFAYEQRRDHDRARALHEENLRRATAAGNGRIQATALSALAEYAFREGALDEASRLLKDSLRVHRELRDLLDTAVDLSRFARVLARREQAESAVRLVACLETASLDVGVRRDQIASRNEETLAAARADLDEDAFAAAWESGAALTLDQALELALDLDG